MSRISHINSNLLRTILDRVKKMVDGQVELIEYTMTLNRRGIVFQADQVI